MAQKRKIDALVMEDEPLKIHAEEITSLALVSPQEIALAPLSAFEQKIAEFSDYKNLTIAGFDDKEGFEKVETARKEVKAAKIQCKKIGEELVAPYNAAVSLINNLRNSTFEGLLEIERDLSGKAKVYNDEQERIKAEEEAAKEARIAKRIDQINTLGAKWNGFDGYEIGSVKITATQVKTLPDDKFISFTEKIEEEYQKALDIRLQKEAEEKAEKDRIEKEKAELESEKQKLADERAEFEKSQKELAEKAAIAERERLEKIAQEQEDRLKEAQRIKDEAKAQAEKVRKAQEEELAAQQAVIDEENRKVEAKKQKLADEEAARLKVIEDARLEKERAEKEEKEVEAKRVADLLEVERLERLKPDLVKFSDLSKSFFSQIEDLEISPVCEKHKAWLQDQIDIIFDKLGDLIK